MKNENFITLQGWMINELKLKGNELIVYGLIYGFSQDGESEYHGSLRYISDAIGLEKSTTQSIVKRLLEKNLVIISTQDSVNGNKYKAVRKSVRTRTKIRTQPVRKSVQINNNTNNNNNNNNRSQKICDPLPELTYEKPPKETFDTKRKTFKKIGAKYTPRKKTKKQEEMMEAFKVIDYFKQEGHSQHGMMFFAVKDDSRNKRIRKQISRISEEIGFDKCKEMIDYWFEGEGDFFQYEPEQCFTTKMTEKFLNKNNRPDDEITVLQ